jgi:hypothetical protein
VFFWVWIAMGYQGFPRSDAFSLPGTEGRKGKAEG